MASGGKSKELGAMDKFVTRPPSDEQADGEAGAAESGKMKMAAAAAAPAAAETGKERDRREGAMTGEEEGGAAPEPRGNPAACGTDYRDQGCGDEEEGTGGRERAQAEGIDYKRLAQEMARFLAADFKQAVTDLVMATTSEMQSKISNHSVQLQEAEQRVSSAEDKIRELEEKVDNLQKQAAASLSKMEDIENRSRRSNLKLIGLPETITTRQLDDIFETELPKALGMTHGCKTERVHRIGPPRESGSKNGNRGSQQDGVIDRPRQAIAKYLNHRDKEEILRAYKARRQPLYILGHKTLLFGDFSIEVTKRRRAFSSVCTLLYNKNVRFQLLFPATLRFRTPDGELRSFMDPEEAMRVVTQNSKAPTRKSPARTPEGDAPGDEDSTTEGPMSQETTKHYNLRPTTQTEGSQERHATPREQRTLTARWNKKAGR